MDGQSSGKTSEVKSILLTTSPLYGDVQPTPRSHIDELVYSTQRSLNIAATHNPTTDISSESDSESEAPVEDIPVAEIWDDDDESDRDSAHHSDEPCPLKQWDYSLSSSWVPPTLKTDQEYEMYQLQSRIEAEKLVRKRLTRQQMSPASHKCGPDELVDTASMSSWDAKTTTHDRSGSRRSLSHGSSSWSDFGVDFSTAMSARSESNKSGFR